MLYEVITLMPKVLARFDAVSGAISPALFCPSGLQAPYLELPDIV